MSDEDERYFEDEVEPPRKSFDATLLNESLKVLPARRPLVFTPDGTCDSKLLGIFSDRDVLYRIVDRGRNPALLPLREVMTADPECVPREATIAWVLNRMAVGGFRHVPVVDPAGHPHSVVSVRDVVDFLVEFFPREVLNLPPEFNRPISTRREGG
jgi:CBS domain-containing protein